MKGHAHFQWEMIRNIDNTLNIWISSSSEILSQCQPNVTLIILIGFRDLALFRGDNKNLFAPEILLFWNISQVSDVAQGPLVEWHRPCLPLCIPIAMYLLPIFCYRTSPIHKRYWRSRDVLQKQMDAYCLLLWLEQWYH